MLCLPTSAYNAVWESDRSNLTAPTMKLKRCTHIAIIYIKLKLSMSTLHNTPSSSVPIPMLHPADTCWSAPRLADAAGAMLALGLPVRCTRAFRRDGRRLAHTASLGRVRRVGYARRLRSELVFVALRHLALCALLVGFRRCVRRILSSHGT